MIEALRDQPALVVFLVIGIGHVLDRVRIGFTTLVALPVTADSALLLWYLTPAPALDARIRERGWETATLYVR